MTMDGNPPRDDKERKMPLRMTDNMTYRVPASGVILSEARDLRQKKAAG